MSDDDMDSGIDGHVSSLEPLFEEDDYILVDKDVNLASLTISESGEGGKARGGSLEGKCPECVQGCQCGSPNNPRKTSLIKSAAFKVGDDSNLESFGCYRESLAANWKPDSAFQVYKGLNVQGKTVAGGGLPQNSECSRSQSVRKRTTQENPVEGNPKIISDFNAKQTSSSSKTQNENGKTKKFIPKNPSLTSFDKVVRHSKKKKERRQKVDLWHSNAKNGSQPVTLSNEGGHSAATEEGFNHRDLARNFPGNNENVVILPEVDEFQVEDTGEEELWHGEEDCETGLECDEMFDDG